VPQKNKPRTANRHRLAITPQKDEQHIKSEKIVAQIAFKRVVFSVFALKRQKRRPRNKKKIITEFRFTPKITLPAGYAISWQNVNKELKTNGGVDKMWIKCGFFLLSGIFYFF
jgi:hypothetical protein